MCLPLPSAQDGVDVLREPQVNVTNSLTSLVQEQYSVRGGLLNHVCVGIVALRPRVRVLVVSVRNQAGEVGLLVARGSGVESEEGGRNCGNGDIETSLSHQSETALRTYARSLSGQTYTKALAAAGGVVGVTGAVAGVATLDLGSDTARGAQGCSLKGLHGV